MNLRHIRPPAAWAQFAALVFVLSVLLLLILLLLFQRAGGTRDVPDTQTGVAISNP